MLRVAIYVFVSIFSAAYFSPQSWGGECCDLMGTERWVQNANPILNPTQAERLIEGPLLEILRNFDPNERNPVRDLVGLLFHRIPGDPHLFPTGIPSEPYSLITPEAIGKFLNLVLLELQKTPSTSKKQEKARIQQMKSLKELRKEKNTLKPKEVATSSGRFSNDDLLRIRLKETLLEDMNQFSPPDNSDGYIRALVNKFLFAMDFCEQNQNYPKGFPIQIFLAYALIRNQGGWCRKIAKRALTQIDGVIVEHTVVKTSAPLRNALPLRSAPLRMLLNQYFERVPFLVGNQLILSSDCCEASFFNFFRLFKRHSSPSSRYDFHFQSLIDMSWVGDNQTFRSKLKSEFSNLEGVEYFQTESGIRYDLKPSLDNFLKLLEIYLEIPENSDLSQKQRLQTACRQISYGSETVSCSIESKSPEPDNPVSINQDQTAPEPLNRSESLNPVDVHFFSSRALETPRRVFTLRILPHHCIALP